MGNNCARTRYLSFELCSLIKLRCITSKTPRLVGHSHDAPSEERCRHEKVEDFSSSNVLTRKRRNRKTKDEEIFALGVVVEKRNDKEE